MICNPGKNFGRKRSLLSILVIGLLFGIVLMAGAASATTLTINDISFTDRGEDKDLKWDVSAAIDPILLDMAVGATETFSYGTFETKDFPLDWKDLRDDDDWFTATFTIDLTGSDTYSTGEVGVNGTGSFFTYIDFGVDTNWTTFDFGDGGEFELQFLDPGPIYANGQYDLEASIHLISDVTAAATGFVAPSSAAAPVPEPATVILFGSGLIGAGFYCRKRQTA